MLALVGRSRIFLRKKTEISFNKIPQEFLLTQRYLRYVSRTLSIVSIGSNCAIISTFAIKNIVKCDQKLKISSHAMITENSFRISVKTSKESNLIMDFDKYSTVSFYINNRFFD